MAHGPQYLDLVYYVTEAIPDQVLPDTPRNATDKKHAAGCKMENFNWLLMSLKDHFKQ